jgi:hypothetical protein
MRNRKRSHGSRGHKPKSRAGGGAPTLAPLERPPSRPPIKYGRAFTLLEDESKATFEFKSGAWVPFSMTIAECRQQQCQVQQLPQKVKLMTRYEVRLPLDE